MLGRRGTKSRQETHGDVLPLDGQAAQRDCGNGPRRVHCGQEPAGRHAQGADYRAPTGAAGVRLQGQHLDLQAAPPASRGQVGLHTRRPQSASTRRAYAPRLRARRARGRQAPRSASPPEGAAQEDPDCRQGRMPPAFSGEGRSHGQGRAQSGGAEGGRGRAHAGRAPRTSMSLQPPATAVLRHGGIWP